MALVANGSPGVARRSRPSASEAPPPRVIDSAAINKSGSIVVAACCGEAVANGVRPGMPLVEAQSLVHGLGVAAYEPEADRRGLVKLAEDCERFSPRVALEDEAEPESLLLDVSDLEHLWGSEGGLLERVKKFFAGHGYVVRMGVADTVGGAWAAAHFGDDGGGFRVSDGELNSRSPSTMPVQSLRISEETAATLRELGIETVGQLATLPREELACRFGDELLRRLDQLTGAGREVIKPQRGLPPLEASFDFEEPTRERAAILHALRRLVDRLSQQLIARNEGAVLLTCLLHVTGGAPAARDGRGGDSVTTPFAKPQGAPLATSEPHHLLRVGLLQPSASGSRLMELIELHLETVKLRGEVDHMTLRIPVVGRLGERQGELFADRWPTDPHQLAVLVNRLSSRLGHDRVLRAEPRASPIPERAVKLVPVVQQRAKELQVAKSKMQIANWKSSKRISPPEINNLQSPPRPLLLYPTPQAMEVVCVAPDGPPQFIWMNQHRERIVGCVGPERIETLWWRGPSARRDYYRVATESGSHLWMFQRLTDRRWFVHGAFA